MRFIIDLPLFSFLGLYFLIIIIVTVIHFYRSRKHISQYSLLFKLALSFYILLLIKVAFLGIQITDKEGYQILVDFGLLDNAQYVQLIPFQTILDVLGHPDMLSVTYIQIVGNIILLMPISFILYYVKQKTIKQTLLYTFGFSLFIETYQLITSLLTQIPSHLFDVECIRWYYSHWYISTYFKE